MQFNRTTVLTRNVSPGSGHPVFVPSPTPVHYWPNTNSILLRTYSIPYSVSHKINVATSCPSCSTWKIFRLVSQQRSLNPCNFFKILFAKLILSHQYDHLIPRLQTHSGFCTFFFNVLPQAALSIYSLFSQFIQAFSFPSSCILAEMTLF